MATLREIEQNIVARIDAFMHNSFAAIVAVSDRKAMKDASQRYPSAFVIFDSEDYPDDSLTFDNVTKAGTMRWQVYIFARNMRSEESEARLGEGGTYDLSDDAKAVLEGFDPINNTDAPNRAYPLIMTNRIHAEDQDDNQNDLYCMLMRFVHEC